MIIKRMFLFYWKTFVLIIVSFSEWTKRTRKLRIRESFEWIYCNFMISLRKLWLNNSSSNHVVSCTEINFDFIQKICVNLMRSKSKLIELWILNFELSKLNSRDTKLFITESRTRINQIPSMKGLNLFFPMLAFNMKWKRFLASHKLKNIQIQYTEWDMIQTLARVQPAAATARNFD